MIVDLIAVPAFVVGAVVLTFMLIVGLIHLVTKKQE